MWQIPAKGRILQTKNGQRVLLLFCFLTFIAYQAISYHSLRNFTVITEVNKIH